MYRTRSMPTRPDAIALVQFRAQDGNQSPRQREAEARRRLEQLREERQLRRDLYDVFGDEVW